ncbi:MAG: tetratricopeptide repeat protein [Sciscionella sp.]
MWEARALNSVGWLSARLGQHAQARTHCEVALTLFRRHHHCDGEAATLDSLGYLAHHTGDHIQALGYYQQALALFRDLGDTYEEASTLDRLGQTHVALGKHEQARAVWREALELYQAQHRAPDAARVAEPTRHPRPATRPYGQGVTCHQGPAAYCFQVDPALAAMVRHVPSGSHVCPRRRVRVLEAGGQSNSPSLAPATNASHSEGVNTSTGPSGWVEFRIAT